jgi:predicted PurR-regulated permease PerM
VGQPEQTVPSPTAQSTIDESQDGNGGVQSLPLLTLAVILLTIFALRELRDVFLPVVLSILLFYALDPLVDRISRWLPRVAATLLVLTTLVGGLAAGLYSLRDEALELVTELPEAMRELRMSLNSRAAAAGPLDKVREAAQEIEKAASEVVRPSADVQRVQVSAPTLNMGEYVWWGSISTAATVSQGVLVLVLTFFLIQSNDLYRHKVVRIVGPRLARKKLTVQVLASIEQQIEQFLRVQIFTSALVGVATWVALRALGVNHAAVWGLAAAVLNWIPVLGPLVVTVGLTVIAWVQFGDFLRVSAVAGTALAITTVEGMLLTPILLSRAARMNPVAVFVGLLFWSWVWGLFGALLAVPMMMAIKAVCDHVGMFNPIGDLLGE